MRVRIDYQSTAGPCTLGEMDATWDADTARDALAVLLARPDVSRVYVVKVGW